MKKIFNRQSRRAVPFLLVLVFFAALIGVRAQGTISAAGLNVYILTTNNQLIRLNSSRPNSNLGSAVTITGLQTGENIVGIDFRPATGQLYGLGSSSRLYTINTATGTATQVGAAGLFTLSGTNFGFDFNPTVDRIRVVSDTGQNLRLNPNDGTLSATDTTLSGGTATAAAYSNSVVGATTTTLYVIDTNTDTLDIQGGQNGTPSPNGGVLTPVGALGFDASGANGFDISTNGVALAALQPSAGTTSNLYNINLTTGSATSLGALNVTGAQVRGLAIASGTTATNVLDFGGDQRADFVNFRQSNAFVYISRPDNSVFGFPFGSFGDDVFQPGDYDGDGRTDIAVFRSSTGVFYVLRSSTNTVTGTQFGLPGDEPVARDYDGDGRTDFAVVRRANGMATWFILNSSTNTATGTVFGTDADITAPGDYDGDGKFDLAVFRGSGNQPGTFYVQKSSGGFTAVQFGVGSDLVVPGDYDGDGKTDFAVVRTGSNYDWYILRSSTNTVQFTRLGTKSYLTVQNDYDGDGKTDVAVYNPANGFYYFVRSSSGTTAQIQFGQNGDYPIANYDTH